MIKIISIIFFTFFLISSCIFASENEVSNKVFRLLNQNKKYHIILLGNIAIKPLIKAVLKGNLRIKKNAIEAMAAIKSSEALDILIKYLKHIKQKNSNEYKEIKLKISEALVNCGNSEMGLGIAYGFLEDNSNKIVDSAVRILGNVGSIDSVNRILKISFNKLIHLHNLFSALEILYHRHKVKWEKNDKLKNRIYELIIYALNSKNSETMFSAIWFAGEINEKRAINILKKLIKSKDSQIRRQSAHSLCLLGDKTGIDITIRDLKGEGIFQSEHVKKIFRRDAARVLRGIRSKKSYNSLVEALDYKDEVIISNAVFSFYMLGNPKAIEPLEKVYKKYKNNRNLKDIFEKTINSLKKINSYLHSNNTQNNMNNAGLITIKAHNVEIWKLFRMIHRITGRRIILNPGVKGTITYSARKKNYLDVIRQIASKKSLFVKIKKNYIEISKKKESH